MTYDKPEPFVMKGFYTPYAWVQEKGPKATHDMIHFSGEATFMTTDDALDFAFWMVEAVEYLQWRQRESRG